MFSWEILGKTRDGNGRDGPVEGTCAVEELQVERRGCLAVDFRGWGRHCGKNMAELGSCIESWRTDTTV